MKKAFTPDPVLTYPNFVEFFVLTTNASDCAVGVAWSQGVLSIAYPSRTVLAAETKYSSIEREWLAIIL